MKYNNETQRLINDSKSSNEDTAERFQEELSINDPSDKEEEVEEEEEDDDCLDNDGSLASKLLNRETCV